VVAEGGDDGVVAEVTTATGDDDVIARSELFYSVGFGEGDGDQVGAAFTFGYAEHVEGRGIDVFEQACSLGLEGIISKRRDLPYQPGRRDSWRKIKCLRRGLFVVGGFTDQEGAQKGLGALLVGRYDGKRLVYCGRVGTGFTHTVARDLRARLEAIEQPACPFDPAPSGPLARTGHWVRPMLVCEATFIEQTSAGVLRAPAFQGIKTGVKPREVVVTAT